MENDKELIGKIKELRRIEPNQEWVFLTKKGILGEESTARGLVSVADSLVSVLRVFFLKPAYAGLLTLFILFGLFGFAQNSLPGDFLYPIKKIAEKSQAVFVSEEAKPQASLELVHRRLEELTIIAEGNKTRKLAFAINEFQASVSEATKNLSMIDATSTDPLAVKRVVDQAKDVEKRAKQVKSLGVVIEGGELQELQEASSKLELELLVRVLEDMIDDLEDRTLTEKQQETLAQMKEMVGEGRFSEALELYLTNQ